MPLIETESPPICVGSGTLDALHTAGARAEPKTLISIPGANTVR